MKEKIELDIVCQSCDGSGLYVGMAERDGAAVICHQCKGTGRYKYKFEFERFTERKRRKDVKRVYGDSCGYVHTVKDVPAEDGTMIQFSKAGVSYDEWLAGGKPEPVRELYCPYLWTSQRLQTRDKNNLYRNRCDNGISFGGLISKCKHYKDKAKCWEIFDGRMGK